MDKVNREFGQVRTMKLDFPQVCIILNNNPGGLPFKSDGGAYHNCSIEVKNAVLVPLSRFSFTTSTVAALVVFFFYVVNEVELSGIVSGERFEFITSANQL